MQSDADFARVLQTACDGASGESELSIYRCSFCPLVLQSVHGLHEHEELHWMQMQEQEFDDQHDMGMPRHMHAAAAASSRPAPGGVAPASRIPQAAASSVDSFPVLLTVDELGGGRYGHEQRQGMWHCLTNKHSGRSSADERQAELMEKQLKYRQAQCTAAMMRIESLLVPAAQSAAAASSSSSSSSSSLPSSAVVVGPLDAVRRKFIDSRCQQRGRKSTECDLIEYGAEFDQLMETQPEQKEEVTLMGPAYPISQLRAEPMPVHLFHASKLGPAVEQWTHTLTQCAARLGAVQRDDPDAHLAWVSLWKDVCVLLRDLESVLFGWQWHTHLRSFVRALESDPHLSPVWPAFPFELMELLLVKVHVLLLRLSSARRHLHWTPPTEKAWHRFTPSERRDVVRFSRGDLSEMPEVRGAVTARDHVITLHQENNKLIEKLPMDAMQAHRVILQSTRMHQEGLLLSLLRSHADPGGVRHGLIEAATMMQDEAAASAVSALSSSSSSSSSSVCIALSAFLCPLEWVELHRHLDLNSAGLVLEFIGLKEPSNASINDHSHNAKERAQHTDKQQAASASTQHKRKEPADSAWSKAETIHVFQPDGSFKQVPNPNKKPRPL